MKKNNCVILAGGKATRLGKICEKFPKALLELGGSSILESQIEWLRNSFTENIIVSTNTVGNKKLIESALSKDNINNTKVLVNTLHAKGSLWGLLGAIELLKLDEVIFSFSDIHFSKSEMTDIPNDGPWLTGHWTSEIEEIKKGGVIKPNAERKAEKLYYKQVPEGLNKVMTWSGLTKLTFKEVSLLRPFLERSNDDVPEEDFINFCIRKGSQFRLLETGPFININSPGDLIKGRNLYDTSNLSDQQQ
jgi:choline kinase